MVGIENKCPIKGKDVGPGGSKILGIACAFHNLYMKSPPSSVAESVTKSEPAMTLVVAELEVTVIGPYRPSYSGGAVANFVKCVGIFYVIVWYHKL